ncbi:methylated-DNA--[protein]-cysteine S-methyltransferase [Sporosarcina ureilytica]|uniref:methylated-DNA--[protein]-cysteine S-methyltransferase n=1 Tax=Sporosarcina ureilytica TaxID=298596 RepID=A0A1D8JDG6_9BACL|nr:methylated-DNA--[protein]-cysteine S-methyltransferase [Sporosarcina ureilytica]AOV06741.1 cysteine methyltransferase [Sporosarcina ureilytica]
MKQTVYWSKVQLAEWSMYMAATEKGLCYIGTPDAPFEELSNWAAKRIRNALLEENQEIIAPYANELRATIDGKGKTFTGQLDLYGTPFQQSVWEVLQTIPYGDTISYTDVAERLQKPKAVRAVGGAIGANPVLIVVPCHRVMTKDGKLGGFRAGLTMKEQLLKLERSGGTRGE